MKPGEWYQTHTEIARKVSACLGLQARAVYDELSSRVDNKSSETWVEPETLAKVFGITERHVRRILSDLREMNAVICLLRGNARVYRVNRTKPELLCAPDKKSTPGPIFPEWTQMSGHIGPEIPGSEQPSIIELDSTAKPENTNPQVLHTSSRGDFAADARAPFLLDCIKTHFARANGYELTPAHEMTLSGAVFDALLNLPLPYWSNDKLSDAVANFFASQRSKTQDPMSPPAKWVCGLYRYRDGPLDAYGKPIEFTDPQEAHGTAGIEIIGKTGARLNAHQLRTANSLRAAAGAFRYFDRIEQAEGDRGGTDEAGGAHPREPG